MDVPTETDPPAATDNYLDIATPPRRPGVWSGIGIVVLYFLMQIAFGMLVAFLLAAANAFQATVAAGKPDAHVLSHASPLGAGSLAIITIASIALAAAVTVAIVHRIWHAQWTRADLPGFGFTQPADKRFYLGAAVLGVVLALLSGPLTQLFAGSHPVHQDIAVMTGKLPLGLFIPMALTIVCVAPFVEELVFRGVLLSGLARRIPVWWAAFATALAFGCAHLPEFKFAWFPLPALVLTGFVLAWMRLKARSLWPAITLHATNNLVAVVGWFLVMHHWMRP